MKWLSFKKITILLLSLVVVSNLFTTNIQTFDVHKEQCHLENLHVNPCAIGYSGDVAYEIEQDTNISILNMNIPMIELEYVSLIQKNISYQKTDFINYYATDIEPPSNKQLPRSHIIVS